MIEQITSLSDEFSMRLRNPIADSLYRVDSINLIIGDNGTGKTNAIKGIIRELAEQGRLGQYAIEGEIKELGVVYYTAAPFHKKLTIVNNKNISIIDASPPREFVNGVAAAAREYQKVAESLKIPNPLLSKKIYDFRDFAFRCVRRLGSSFRGLLSQKSAALYEEYRNLSRETLRFSHERKRVEERQYALLSQSGEARGSSDSIFAQAAAELHRISLDSEAHSLKISNLREAIIDQYLGDMGPNNRKWAIIWIAAFLYCEGATASISVVAKYIQTRNDELKPKSERWNSLLATCLKFIKSIEAEDAGTFEWSKDVASISVDIMRLLGTKAGEQAFETGHRLGLLAFGFDAISSGEAAILNQLTSITNAIQEIKETGKRKILLFIDEGDILLHLSWQRRYLNLLDERLGYLKAAENLDSLQVIVASHSPLLASDVLRTAVTRMRKTGELPAFGAPIQLIINRSFDTPSIGEIAEREILRLQKLDQYSSIDLAMIEQIDDEFIRQYLKKNK